MKQNSKKKKKNNNKGVLPNTKEGDGVPSLKKEGVNPAAVRILSGLVQSLWQSEDPFDNLLSTSPIL